MLIIFLKVKFSTSRSLEEIWLLFKTFKLSSHGSRWVISIKRVTTACSKEVKIWLRQLAFMGVKISQATNKQSPLTSQKYTFGVLTAMANLGLIHSTLKKAANLGIDRFSTHFRVRAASTYWLNKYLVDLLMLQWSLHRVIYTLWGQTLRAS